MKQFFTTTLVALLALQSQAITVTIGTDYSPNCDYANGYLNTSVSGGVPPYTYLWSNGSTDPGLYGVQAGTYTVTVTDANLDTASDTFVLQSIPLSTWGQFVPDCVDESLQLGPEYRMLAYATSGMPGVIGAMGVEPITLDPGYTGTLLTHSSGASFMYIYPLGEWPPGGEFEIPFTDGSGCAGTVNATVPAPPAFPSVQLLSVGGSCTGTANGSVELYVGQAPNQWHFNLELVRDGTSLGLLRSEYSTNTDFGSTPHTVIRHDLAAGEYMVLTSSVAQDYFLQEIMENYFSSGLTSCKDTLFFTVPDLGVPCGTVYGEVFLDDDLNCVRNGSERRYAQSVFEIQPGGTFATSDAFGYYWAQLPYGNYTVEQQSAQVAEHCTGAPIPFEITAGDPIVDVDIPDTSLVSRDVSITLGSGPARPGFEMLYGMRVNNLTLGSVSGVQVTMTFDPLLSYVSGTPNPASVVGNVVTWNLGSIATLGLKTVHLTLQVPADVGLIGTDLAASASVSISQVEPDLSNNSFSTVTTVTGSYDPNDKQAFTESNNDGSYFINEDEWIDYTIRFQNTGTDTAFFVVITDTLPNTVDPASFVTGAASHHYTMDLSGQGILRFTFPNILLPDSNVNELASHGFVTFRIKAMEPVLPGTIIENIANIYFDYNPPIITEPSVLVAEFSTGVNKPIREALTIAPNPVSDLMVVDLTNSAMATVVIHSSDGRIVEVPQRPTTSGLQLDVRGLANGVYVLQHLDRTVRFIKQ
jgi:uncharacterized repeat protein (TIGR01451 family)